MRRKEKLERCDKSVTDRDVVNMWKQLSHRIGKTRSFIMRDVVRERRITRCEKNLRRLDIVEVIYWNSRWDGKVNHSHTGLSR